MPINKPKTSIVSTEKSGNTEEATGNIQLAERASRAEGVLESEEKTLSEAEKKWFIAVVGFNTEKSSSKKLSDSGYEIFLPVQEKTSIWKDGRKKKREIIVIPSIVFVHITEEERKEVVKLPFVKKFMIDPAGEANSFNRHPIATIPDEQMKQFKFMLGHSENEVSIESRRLKIGSKIKIKRGSLSGLEGELYQTVAGSSFIIVQLNCLGFAKAEVSLSDVEELR